MARVNRRAEDDDQDATEGGSKKSVRKVAAPAPVAPVPRRSRWKLFFGFLLLAAFLALVPDIVARTELRNHAFRVIAPRFPGRVQIGRATLSWWNAPLLEDVTITGADGNDLLTIARISGAKRMFELATHPAAPGSFRIERPVLTVVVRPDGSTLEDALEPLLSARRTGSTRLVDAKVEVVEGRVELISGTTRRRASLEEISVTIDSSADPATGVEARFSARLAGDRTESAGGIRIDVTWKPGESAGSTGEPGSAKAAAPTIALPGAPTLPREETLQGTVHIDGLRLDSLDPLWTRLEETLVVEGVLNADLRLRGLPADNQHPPRVGAGGELTIDGLRLVCPSRMKSDELKLARTNLTGSVELTPEAVAADHLKITTEPAQLEAHGTFPLAVLSDPGTWRQFWKTASSEDYSLTADVDLARVAAHLPHAVRLRHDVELTRGRLRATLESREENGERVMEGSFETSDLDARTPGGPLSGPEPVSCRVTARMTNEGLVVDRLVAKASFLEAAGLGNLRKARLVAKCDLDRFTADFGRIFDLSEFQLSGRMSADCECRQSDTDAERLIVTGRIGFDDFVWGGPGREPLREKRLAVDLNAEASVHEQKPARLHSASLRVQGEQNDELVAELQRPVMIAEVAEGGADIPVRLSLIGPLRQWQQRARPWFDPAGWTLGGDADLSADIVSSGELLSASNIQGTVRQLAVAGPELAIQEEWVQATGSAVWNRRTRELTADELTLNSNSVSLRSERVIVTVPEQALPTADGLVTFRGDLERLARWRRTGVAASAAPAYRGAISGELAAKNSGSVMTARLDARIIDLSILEGSSSRALGDVTLSGVGAYDASRDVATIEKLSVASDTIALDAAGSISAASTQPWADVSGTASYDWQSLQGLVASVAGDGVKLTGRRSEAFTYKGPLSAPEPVTRTPIPVTNVSVSREATSSPESAKAANLNDFWMRAMGSTRFGWQTGDFYGLATGPVDLDLRLADGVVRASPLNLEVSGGRITGRPYAVMSSGPAMLVFDKERVIENVRFTPEMCRNWVKYVTPLLADATQIDGRFSVDLDGARVPLAEPKHADVGGFLLVPQADVRPGPLAEKVLTVVRQVEVLLKKRSPEEVGKAFNPLLVLRDQNVEFRLLDGRVHHRGLEIQVGNDMTVRTSGSVGLDESLALVAEIPIRDEWVRRDRILAGLQGQTLRIPIQGTFDRPQIDQRAFQELAGKLATGAVTNTIEGEVSKQLDRLLPGSRTEGGGRPDAGDLSRPLERLFRRGK